MNKDLDLNTTKMPEINVLKQRLYIFVCRLFSKALKIDIECYNMTLFSYMKTTWTSGTVNIWELELFFFLRYVGLSLLWPLSVAEHRLWRRRPSGRGSRAQPLRGMWDLPEPGHEPVSPASAGGLSTTAPPGKSGPVFLITLHIQPFFNRNAFCLLEILFISQNLQDLWCAWLQS